MKPLFAAGILLVFPLVGNAQDGAADPQPQPDKQTEQTFHCRRLESFVDVNVENGVATVKVQKPDGETVVREVKLAPGQEARDVVRQVMDELGIAPPPYDGPMGCRKPCGPGGPPPPGCNGKRADVDVRIENGHAKIVVHTPNAPPVVREADLAPGQDPEELVKSLLQELNIPSEPQTAETQTKKTVRIVEFKEIVLDNSAAEETGADKAGAAPDAAPAMPDLTIFPTPNDGRFTVRLAAGSAAPVQVSVFDAAGKRIYETTVPAREAWEHTLTAPASGVYIIEAVSNGAVRRLKTLVN